MKVTVDELVLFCAIVESGSFSRAAESLNIAASVASRSLKKLEAKLESTLLYRTTRHVTATEEGLWLYQQAAEILAQLGSVEDHFLHTEGRPSGIVKVDAATPFTLHAIAPLIAGFKAIYPGISVVLESSESNINLIERKVDIAIRIGELENSSLKCRKLGDTWRGMYAAPDYLARYGVPENAVDLLHHQCLGFSRAEHLNCWPVLDNSDAQVVIKPEIMADSGESLRQLALQGNGIACLSAFTVQRDVAEGRLVPLLETETLAIPIPVYLVYHADKTVSRRVRCLIDYIAEHINLEG